MISNLPTPNCVRDIRSFLGHAGFYRRFIKDFSAIARPLCNLLAKDVPFAWSQAYETAFDKLKTMLVSPPIMQSPNWDLPFKIMCDASDYAIGAVLGQREDKKAFGIYYVSKTLDSAQANYTTTERVFSRRLCPRKVQVIHCRVSRNHFHGSCSAEVLALQAGY